MLVVTRKPRQWITIGDNIRVFVIEVSGQQVRLGIEAPPEVVILRNEIEHRPLHKKPRP